MPRHQWQLLTPQSRLLLQGRASIYQDNIVAKGQTDSLYASAKVGGFLTRPAIAVCKRKSFAKLLKRRDGGGDGTQKHVCDDLRPTGSRPGRTALPGAAARTLVSVVLTAVYYSSTVVSARRSLRKQQAS